MGQLQSRLHGQRAGSRRPRPVRSRRALRVRTHQLRRATDYGGRFRRQPGTLSSYEQFLGTGGSLYFLHHQDILTGSESVHIEVRDKASNIITGVVNLRPNVDYDIDYLQGRLLLSEPLSASANDNLLVRTSGLSGDQSILVVRYEYTPGLGQAGPGRRRWSGQLLVEQLHEAGLHGRFKRGRRGQQSRRRRPHFAEKRELLVEGAGWPHHGLLSPSLQSNDGGFGFQGPDDTSLANSKAGAYRADMSVGLSDFVKGHDGRFQSYTQRLDAGYSAPGQLTLKDTQQYGGLFKMPVTSRLTLMAKADQRTQDQGLDTRAMEWT